jgi:hypothetical protein
MELLSLGRYEEAERLSLHFTDGMSAIEIERALAGASAPLPACCPLSLQDRCCRGCCVFQPGVVAVTVFSWILSVSSLTSCLPHRTSCRRQRRCSLPSQTCRRPPSSNRYGVGRTRAQTCSATQDWPKCCSCIPSASYTFCRHGAGYWILGNWRALTGPARGTLQTGRVASTTCFTDREPAGSG